MNTEIYDLGKIGITLGGTWNSITRYEKLTVVEYNGSGYCSLVDNNSKNPETNPNTWMKIVSKGKSSYEEMVDSGTFQGTEKEYLTLLRSAINAATASSEAIVKAEQATALVTSKTQEVNDTLSSVNTAMKTSSNLLNTLEENIKNAESSTRNAESAASLAQSQVQIAYDKIESAEEKVVRAETAASIVNDAIQSLPDSQAVVVTVQEHTNNIAELNDKSSKINQKFNYRDYEVFDAYSTESRNYIELDNIIPANTTIRIHCSQRDMNDTMLIYGKTSISDETYETIAELPSAGSDKIKTISKDIKYIRITNATSARGKVTIAFTSKDSKTTILNNSISDVNSIINNLKDVLVTEKTIYPLYATNSALKKNGTVVSGFSANVTDYIPITEANYSFAARTPSDTNIYASVVIYDFNKTVIKTLVGSVSSKDEIFNIKQQDGAYFRFQTNNVPEIKVTTISVLQDINDKATQALEKIGYYDDFIYADYETSSNSYLSIDTIPANTEIKVTCNSRTVSKMISVYGKTNTSDSDYQTIGVLPSEGRSIIYKTTKDINYIRLNNATGEVGTNSILIQSNGKVGQGIELKLYEIQKNIDTKDKTIINVPYNQMPFPVDRNNIKILTIGNSFTDNAYTYLRQIIAGSNIEGITLGRSFYPSCSLSKEVNAFDNNDAIFGFYISKNGASFETIANQNGAGTLTDGMTLKQIIDYEDWDIIILQQNSANSANWNTYETDLLNLIRRIRCYTKNNPKIGFHLTWALSKNHTTVKTNFNGDQEQMYEALVNVSKKLKIDYNFDLIINTYQAFQNCRNNEEINNVISDLLQDDGQHANDYGKYVAGCMYFQSLIGMMFNKSIKGNTYRNSFITDDIASIIQQCVINAHVYPNEIKY